MAIDVTLVLNSTAYGTRTNTTATEPTSAAENDIFIAALYIKSDSAVTAPSGWDLLYSVNFVSGAVNLYVYGIRRGASSPALTWTHASAVTELCIKRYTGCALSGSYEDCTGSTNSATGSYTYTATSITTASDGAALVMIAAEYDGGYAITFGSWTSPLTERYDGRLVGMADGLQASAGASGNKTATGSDAVEWATVMLALKPAAAGGGNPWYYYAQQ